MSGGLQILHKKVIIYTLIFVLLIGFYIFELKWLKSQIINLKGQYQDRVNLALKTSELIARKRNLEDLEKKLQNEIGLSLEKASQILQENLPFLQKIKIKESLAEKWFIDWQQNSSGEPPEAVVSLLPKDLPNFFHFLQTRKISYEVTNFRLEKQGVEFKLTLIFAH